MDVQQNCDTNRLRKRSARAFVFVRFHNQSALFFERLKFGVQFDVEKQVAQRDEQRYQHNRIEERRTYL